MKELSVLVRPESLLFLLALRAQVDVQRGAVRRRREVRLAESVLRRFRLGAALRRRVQPERLGGFGRRLAGLLLVRGAALGALAVLLRHRRRYRRRLLRA